MAPSTPCGVAMVFAMVGARLASAAEVPCPSPAAIAAELQRLPDAGAAVSLSRSEVKVEGRTMRIELRDSGGQVLGVREVEAPRDCRQRAAVAAVVLAAWSHTWEDTAAPVVAAVAPRRLTEVGLQGGVHHDVRRLAAGVALSSALQLSGSLGVAARADFATGRIQPLGPGDIVYSFARAGAGPVYRLERGRSWIDGALFFQVVRVAVTPRNLPAARAASLWTGAIQTRIRVGLQWGRLMPFLAAGAGRRFVRDRLTLDDNPEPAELSPWDLELGAGLALQFGQ